MLKTLTFIRHNAIALLALFIALGGTSYAALNLPAGSISTRELHNGAVTNKKLANASVTPAKFDGRAIGGSVRHWAHVSQLGQILGGGKGARASGGPIFQVSWGDRFSSRCAALVTPAGNAGASPIADTTGVAVIQPGTARGSTVVNVTTYVGGTATAAPFYIAVIC
ncbi:MAG: hypothetical protein ACYC91_19390 [Solirubrobacteraceae bacterium]